MAFHPPRSPHHGGASTCGRSRWLTGLMLVLLAGCGSREAGIGVTVTLSAARPLPSQVTLARVSLTQLRLVPCGEVMAALSPVSVAWAHEGSSPTPLLSTTAVDVDLRSTGTALATFAPPPELLCGVEVSLGPLPGPERWSDATYFIDVTTAAATRSYFSRSARSRRLLFAPTELSATKRRHALAIEFDPTLLSSLDPLVNDAHHELLEALMASLSASMFQS